MCVFVPACVRASVCVSVFCMFARRPRALSVHNFSENSRPADRTQGSISLLLEISLPLN